MPLIYILSAVARELLSAFIINYRFIPIYVIVVLLIKMQHEKQMGIVTNWLGVPSRGIWNTIKEMMFYGSIIGFFGGVIVVSTGITLAPEVFEYLLIIMAVLILFNIRFICISYSAALLALIAVAFKISNIDVASLLALVAVMHFFESILVFAGAGRDCEPVYIKHGQSIAGAFITRRIWPVPVIFLTFLAQRFGDVTLNSINTIKVDWWTLFNSSAVHAGALAIGLDCAVSALCYTDIAIARKPENKSRETAIWLLIYSILLFILAVISRNISLFKVMGALFALGGHEFIFLYGRYREMNNSPLFIPVRRGVRVLDVLPDSHAWRIGIRRGDIILSINSRDVQTEEGITEALRTFPTFIWVKLLDVDGIERTYEYKCYPDGINHLEILTVPRENEVTYNMSYFENYNVLKNLVKRFRGNSKSI
ncbi:MAG TPA: PDZ domain-containing protein [Clostridiales bacterium]|nr:PDZ domain-containing protein [Clostridiales bacterium]